MLGPMTYGIASIPSGEAGGIAYDGVPNIVAAFGMRRLLTSYTGNLLRIRRNSDSAQQDFGYDGNGDLDTAAIATFIGASTGFVVTWYDQSGNGRNATQATTTAQPIYVASDLNSKPVASFNGTSHTMAFSASSVVSMIAVIAGIDNTQSFRAFVGHNTTTFFGWGGSTTALRYRANSVNTDFTFSAIPTAVVISIVRTGTSASGWVNDVAATNNPQTANDTATGSVLMGRPDLSSFTTGKVAEVVIADGAWSAGDRDTAEAAANAYWNIF